jgi:hypothetical protein
VFAYALEAVEQEARAHGGSILDARDEFHRRFNEELPVSGKGEPVAKVREQQQAQQELMAAMGKARG